MEGKFQLIFHVLMNVCFQLMHEELYLIVGVCLEYPLTRGPFRLFEVTTKECCEAVRGVVDKTHL